MLWPRGDAPAPDVLRAMATRAFGGRTSVGSSWRIADSDLAVALAHLHRGSAPLPAALAALVTREEQRRGGSATIRA